MELVIITLTSKPTLTVVHSLCLGASGRLASFPGSCAGEEEREPGTHCSCMRQVPLVTCILLRYTKIMVNFCLPPERSHCMDLYSLWDTYGRY